MEIPINYWAVLACGVYAMMLGFLWYGPLFGKKWANLMGWGSMSEEEVKAKQKKAMPLYAVSFVTALIMAYVLAHGLIFGNAYLNMSGVVAGLQGSLWYWLGFVMPIMLGGSLWGGKHWKLLLIDGGYYLVQILGMGVILSLWV